MNTKLLIITFLIGLSACKSNKIKLLEKKNEPIKKKLKQTFQVGPENANYYYRNQACLELADIYILEHKYDSALIYLKLSENKYRPVDFGCSSGNFERYYLLDYKYALCFAGMDQLDSAINRLTPKMFVKQEDVFIDSSQYQKINKFYLELLFSKYSKKELKNKINSSLEKLVYLKQKDTSVTNTDSTQNWVCISCYFLFLDSQVFALDYCIEENSWDSYSLKFLSKEYLYKYIKETKTYKELNK